MSQRFDHRMMVVQIMEVGDVAGAMKHIISTTKGDNPQRRRAVFDNIRTRILKNESYKCPHGMDQLRYLAKREGSNPSDKIKLQTLLYKPLHFIRWAQVTKRFLSDNDLQEELKSIRIVKDPFYEFDCPQNIKDLVSADIEMGIHDNHNHKRKPREHYIFTAEEVDEMVTTATDYIQKDIIWSKKCNSLRLLECLSLLTGRRKWELCSTLKIRTSPKNDYIAEVQGLAKNIKSMVEDAEWVEIPLLAPVQLIIRGITNIRLVPYKMGAYVGGTKLFPKMTHTHYRNIYVDKAYENRNINKFHEGSCSELEWKRCALQVTMLTYTNRYATMITDNVNVDVDCELGDSILASEASGSQVDQQQDPI